MHEIFDTVLYLSLIGAGATLVLTALKPITVKRLHARWQYYIWLVTVICMLVPFWKFIPQQSARQLTEQLNIPVQTTVPLTAPDESRNEAPVNENYNQSSFPHNDGKMPVYDILPYVWAAGAGIFMLFAFGSYSVFLYRKRRNCLPLKSHSVFEGVKKELKIKRKIRVRISNDTDSPMLVGTLFPVIYIPAIPADAEAERMIFRHELTHYKHGDLLYKWLTLFVNAVHWFNPFAYLLSANVNQACEVACDMSVIKDMTEHERLFYMETILNMVQGKRRLK